MRSQPRRGYVLVVTLVLIAIAAVLLASLARYSLRVAVASIEQERQLQIKWGTASIELVAMSNPEQILSQPDEPREGEVVLDSRPIPRRQATATLGSQSFVWSLADEQAKLNVNLWDVNRSDEDLAEVVRVFAPPGTVVELSPIEHDLQNRSDTAYQSLGQLCDLRSIWSSAGASQLTRQLGEFLTCWGEGARLNIYTAAPEVLVEVCSLAVSRSQADELVAIRDANPDLTLSQMLDQMQLRLGKRNQLEKILTERSRAWSIWIRSNDGNSTALDRFVVQERIGASSKRVFVFTW